MSQTGTLIRSESQGEQRWIESRKNLPKFRDRTPTQSHKFEKFLETKVSKANTETRRSKGVGFSE